MVARDITAVITNYNGRGNLEAYLPAVLEAFRPVPGHQVLVVDDCSTDDSLAFLQERFPEVRVVAHEVNQGFPGAANSGFQAATTPFVFLLSSDMVPDRGCIERMATLLDSAPDVLSISGPQVLPDGSPLCGRFRGVLRRGSLRVRDHLEQPTRSDGRVYHQFQNAVGLYRREHFLALGGFCELFAPFYFEEVDLSYRAWKLGYRILYEPEARIVHHVEHSSIAAAHGKKARQAHHRIHQYYLFWKNVDQPAWMASHALWLGVRVLFSWLWGDWPFYQACAGFFRNRERLLAKRRWIQERARMSDDQVLDVSTRTLGAGAPAA